jgi:hypothetical protein
MVSHSLSPSSDNIAFDGGPARLPPGRPPLKSGKAHCLHAAIAQEAQDIALLVAVSGSIINAILTFKQRQLQSAAATYLPPQPILFPVAVAANSWGDTMLPATIQSMTSFYGLIAFARTATVNFGARREPGDPAPQAAVVAKAWEAAATQSINILGLLGLLHGNAAESNNDTAGPGPLRLVEVLTAVAAGHSPCVRIDGTVIIPGWLEPRTNVRREVSLPATVSVNGTQQSVMVRNVSATGMGLEGGASLKPGDRVRIEIGNGQSHEGIAVWNRDGRVGIKFAPVDSSSSAANAAPKEQPFADQHAPARLKPFGNRQ